MESDIARTRLSYGEAPLIGDRLVNHATRVQVLLVEDDRDTREVLRMILESDGMVVTPASDGFDALARLEEIRTGDSHAPAAIVLDYMMPRCSGAQFREHQLANPSVADVPVILVSAISDLRRHVAPLRPFAVLQKPVDPEHLIATVRDAAGAYLAQKTGS